MERKRPKHRTGPKPARPKRVREARAEYVVADDAPGLATTRLSSKNQITIPAAMVRALGLEPGDSLMLVRSNGSLTLTRRPRTPDEWLERVGGSMSHVPDWSSDEAIDEWCRRLRHGGDLG